MEKIKETVDNLQKNVIGKNSSKQDAILKFQQAVKQRELESESETIKILRDFEHDMKIVFRKFEAQDPKWREEMKKLEDSISRLKDNLMYVEVVLQEDIEVAIKDFDTKLTTVTKDMEHYTQEDHGFKKISKAIDEFNKKLLEIAR